MDSLVNKIDPSTGLTPLQSFAADRPTVGRFKPSVLKWKMLAWLAAKLKDTFFSGVPQFTGLLPPGIEAFFFTWVLGYTVRVGNSNTREKAMHRRIMSVLAAFRAGSKKIVALDQDEATDAQGEEEEDSGAVVDEAVESEDGDGQLRGGRRRASGRREGTRTWTTRTTRTRRPRR